MSNTSLQFFVILQSLWGIFQQKYMYSESILNSSYVYDVIETSKEVLAGLLMMLTFLSRAASPPSLTFSDKSHIAIFFIRLSKKHY